jgi:hypothetical protein
MFVWHVGVALGGSDKIGPSRWTLHHTCLGICRSRAGRANHKCGAITVEQSQRKHYVIFVSFNWPYMD